MRTPISGIRSAWIQQSVMALVMGVGVAVLSGCATTGSGQESAASLETDANQAQAASDQEGAEASPADPYEGFNRKIFYFNDKVDNYIAEPISDAYRWITPQFVQTGIFNFFNNLKNINVVLNDMMQAKFAQSAQDGGRFLMNTTVGVGGLFDVAKHVGWEQNDEDFDQTLAVWGVPQGSYLVIPFLGPTTSRGIPGTVFDTAANPSTYVGWPVQLVSMLNTRANAEGSLKFIDEAALDPYVFTRESYLQWRKSLANDGESDLSGFEDELDDLDGNEGHATTDADDKSKGSPSALKTGQASGPGSQSDESSAAVENKQFAQVSDSFGGVTQSFDETARSFEEASEKLDRLYTQKKAKKVRMRYRVQE
ncbi:MAG: MlaA family lipoprotein [Gammaproteobacteria bacterium]